MNTLIVELKQNIPFKRSLRDSAKVEPRSARAFRSKEEEKRYWILLSTLIALGLLASFGLLVYNNPVPMDSPAFIPVVKEGWWLAEL